MLTSVLFADKAKMTSITLNAKYGFAADDEPTNESSSVGHALPKCTVGQRFWRFIHYATAVAWECRMYLLRTRKTWQPSRHLNSGLTFLKVAIWHLENGIQSPIGNPYCYAWRIADDRGFWSSPLKEKTHWWWSLRWFAAHRCWPDQTSPEACSTCLLQSKKKLHMPSLQANTRPETRVSLKTARWGQPHCNYPP